MTTTPLRPDQAIESNFPSLKRRSYRIRFPRPDDPLTQDTEWCEVFLDDEWRTFRFHDYSEIYSIPGLYERLFYKTLKCSSPLKVVDLLAETVAEYDVRPEELRVLDVGAGNGMVGQRLHELGVEEVVGIDIIPEAAAATDRDRPGMYDDYIVGDLTELRDEQRSRIEAAGVNCMTVVAALGFGDIPVRAFTSAYNFVEPGGWVAFNLKEQFVDLEDSTGFAKLIRRLTESDMLRMHSYRRYCHRLSVSGERLYYVAMVARKRADVGEELIQQVLTEAAA
ncbi:MAG: methyltransferase domain-containing protein [Planctomycetota bacterium]